MTPSASPKLNPRDVIASVSGDMTITIDAYDSAAVATASAKRGSVASWHTVRAAGRGLGSRADDDDDECWRKPAASAPRDEAAAPSSGLKRTASTSERSATPTADMASIVSENGAAPASRVRSAISGPHSAATTPPASTSVTAPARSSSALSSIAANR